MNKHLHTNPLNMEIMTTTKDLSASSCFYFIPRYCYSDFERFYSEFFFFSVLLFWRQGFMQLRSVWNSVYSKQHHELLILLSPSQLGLQASITVLDKFIYLKYKLNFLKDGVSLYCSSWPETLLRRPG